MKKSFNAHIAPVIAVAAAAIFGFIMSGCDKSDGIQEMQNVTPLASDFTITGLSAVEDGNQKNVIIRPKTGKSQGLITIYYEGTSGTVYPKSTVSPFAAGKYAVTFDVGEAEGFNGVNGLRAGTLTISVKAAGGSENNDEDEDDTDDDYTDKGDDEEDLIDDFNEEIAEPLSLIDFEDSAWTGKDAGSYKNRKVTFKKHEWSVSGVTNMIAGDHFLGSRSIRLRGKTPDDDLNVNHIELLSYLSDGIKSISFDYASYGGNSYKGGTIILSCKREDGDWEEFGRITDIPSWSGGGSQMLNAEFEVNITGKVRFRIEKVNAPGSTSVNIDNIFITAY